MVDDQKCAVKLYNIKEIFPFGQKLSAVAVEYNQTFEATEFETDTFSVKGRTVLRVYTNGKPEKAEKCEPGNYILIELSTDEDAADAVVLEETPEGKHRLERYDIKASVCQNSPIGIIGSQAIPAWKEYVKAEHDINPIVDDFIQGAFEDIFYNLYVPKDYDSSRKYPLIVFVPDKGCNRQDVLFALQHGIGGVVWASEKEQQKHSSIVLAVQIPQEEIVNDEYEAAPQLETIKRLIDQIKNDYSVDADRIYTTGQSQGCMTSCELMIRYPDFFAAGLMVAAPWSAERMAALTEKKFWILVAEGDSRAFNGMCKVVDALEAAGAKVGRYYWDGHAPKQVLEKNVQDAVADGTRIKFTVFPGKTVIPENDTKGWICHSSTWPLVYSLEGVRDWLTTQIRD